MSPDLQPIIDEVNRRCADGEPFDLWVPDALLTPPPGGPTGMVMAIIGDVVLSHGFWPDGFREGDGGRHYRYKPDL